jgi:hypothetical protein
MENSLEVTELFDKVSSAQLHSVKFTQHTLKHITYQHIQLVSSTADVVPNLTTGTFYPEAVQDTVEPVSSIPFHLNTRNSLKMS